MRVHVDKTCPTCGLTFKSDSSAIVGGRTASKKLSSHQRSCGKHQKRPKRQRDENNNLPAFLCETCGKSYVSKRNFNNHSYLLKCQFCHIRFKCKNGLNKHLCPQNIRIQWNKWWNLSPILPGFFFFFCSMFEIFPLMAMIVKKTFVKRLKGLITNQHFME